ncbi:MAG: patatin-like phospholipase family protein [Cyclobacteriaceae bacterium]
MLSKWEARPTKRVLALDGGGIRGALTLGFLERMELLLRVQHNVPSLLLSEYFFLFSGTCSGSFFATGLALGMTVEEIKSKYLELGGKIFNKKRKPWLKDFGIGLRYFLAANYDEGPLEKELKNTFSNEENKPFHLGSDAVRTGLCIVAKRADTFSTWLFHNNPRAKFYDSNKQILLWELVRASSAAPTFFRPVKVHVGNSEVGAFVDGGVSSANNPALMAFLMATVKGFKYNWEAGADKLMIVSVGTGFKLNEEKDLDKMLMQAFSNSSTAHTLDMEVDNLGEDLIGGSPLFHYNRYTMALEYDTLKELGRDFSQTQIDGLIQMDRGENAQILYELGSEMAKKSVRADHFPTSFSLIQPVKTNK